MLGLLWLTSKLFITPFKILEGYVMESKLHCLLFHSQVQETQVEPTCLLEKKTTPKLWIAELAFCALLSQYCARGCFSHIC